MRRRIAVLLEGAEHHPLLGGEDLEAVGGDVDAPAEAEGFLGVGLTNRAAPLEDDRLEQHLEAVCGHHHDGVVTGDGAGSVEQFHGKGHRLGGCRPEHRRPSA